MRSTIKRHIVLHGQYAKRGGHARALVERLVEQLGWSLNGVLCEYTLDETPLDCASKADVIIRPPSKGSKKIGRITYNNKRVGNGQLDVDMTTGQKGKVWSCASTLPTVVDGSDMSPAPQA
eukprot:3660217-Rhodomonas_salina.2